MNISKEETGGAEGPLQPSTNWLEFMHVTKFELTLRGYLLIFLRYIDTL